MDIKKRYDEAFIPGPTIVPNEVLSAYSIDYGSSDIEPSFFESYSQTQQLIVSLLNSPSTTSSAVSSSSGENEKPWENEVIIQVGEGMLALWSALKSVLSPGDKVLCIVTGLFGHGFISMAESLSCQVSQLTFPSHSVPSSPEDLEKIRLAISSFRPHLITCVHCETPSTTILPLLSLTNFSREFNSLLLVDMVSSAFACPLGIPLESIDLGCIGSQKALSCAPSLCAVTVSNKAWDKIKKVDYKGYDALLPWKDSVQKKYMPYSFYWAGLEGMKKSLEMLKSEGMENVYNRHIDCKQLARTEIKRMGLQLFVEKDEDASESVTGVVVPSGVEWKEMDAELRKQRVCFGGNYGDLEGKVFRIGHMGFQANVEKLKHALQVLEQVVKDLQAKKNNK